MLNMARFLLLLLLLACPLHAVVSSPTSATTYSGTGTTATYPYTWGISQAADLVCYEVVVATGTITKLTLNTDYTVSGVGIYTGGSITLIAGNLPTGTNILIASDPAQVQLLLLQQGAAFNPADLMNALDYLTREVQATRRVANNALQIPLTDSLAGLNTSFPAAAQRAGMYPVFDPFGNITVTAQAPAVAAMTSVLNLSALKNIVSPLTSTAYATTGYYTSGDGGAAIYFWNSTDTRSDNGGTIIQLTGGGTGRFNIIGPPATYNVQQFGAKGDGTTDDTSAIQTAINQVVIGTTPGVVYFPPKRFLTSGITITAPNSNNNASGEKSLTILGHGATLAGSGSATAILSISPSQSPLTFANGIVIEGITLDMGSMTNSSSNYGLYLTNTYNDLLQEVVVINQPSSAFSLYIQYRAYTNTFQRCQFGNAKLAGNILNSDAITTQKFSQCSASQFAVDKSFGIDFDACVVQSASGSKYLLSNCFTINIHNGDIEGAAGTYLDLTGGGVSYLISTGNNVSSSLTFISGTGTAVRLDDKKRGPFASPYGAPNTNYPTTGPNTIWTYDGDASGGTLSSSLVMVSGDDGTRGFVDLLFVAYGQVFVVGANNIYGSSQPTRTYAMSGTNLQLTRSTTNCGNIKIAVLDNPQ